MGRFSAPQFDRDRDGDDHGHDAAPMDWTLIPEEDEDEDEDDDYDDRAANNLSRDISRLDVHDDVDVVEQQEGDSQRSLVCRDAVSGSGAHGEECQADHGGNNNAGRTESGSRHADAEDANHAHHHRRENRVSANHNNDRQALFMRAAGQYMEQSNYYLEQQHLAEKRRTRIRRMMIVVVAVIAVVLKRHAPPPPPLSNRSSFATTSSLSPGSEGIAADGRIFSTDAPVHDSASGMPGVTQHETWASYSRHFLFLVQQSLSHGLSVAWYAVSNAFCYALEEVRDIFMAYLHGDESNGDASLWKIWKKKLKAENVDHNAQAMAGLHHNEDVTSNRKSPCPIHLPAASNRHTHLPRGATGQPTTEGMPEGWSTEEFIRQTIGASLSPQNLALKIIAEAMNSWGDSMIEAAPVALVHKMATAISTSPSARFIDDDILSQWILPPAAGFLLVGPEGVGKLHAAHRLAYLLLGHCTDATDMSAAMTQNMQELDGVLEIIAGEYDHNNDEVNPVKEMIINLIHSRKGLGSVIVIHHIEALPKSIVSELSQVLSGKTDVLSYQTPEKLVEASCNGAVFVLTSKQWGTKSIFQHIQRNNGLTNGLRRESLISSIRWEVDSNLDHWNKLASHTTVVPFFPFQQEDIASILQSRIQTLNVKYQGSHWKQVEVSHATIKYSVGIDHVDYLDLYNEIGRSDEAEEEEGDAAALLTFSTSGAHALDNNPLWQILRTRVITGMRRRPGLTLKVHLDDNMEETVFSWCTIAHGGLESCEIEWRSLLT